MDIYYGQEGMFLHVHVNYIDVCGGGGYGYDDSTLLSNKEAATNL